MCQCLIFLEEPLEVANILEKLSRGSSADALMAYQIAFDMYESATQQFLSRVLSAIRKTAPGVEDEPMKGGEEKMEEDGGEEKKVEVVEKKELTGEEAELQSKVRKPWIIVWGKLIEQL